jgi:hypothetical protein
MVRALSPPSKPAVSWHHLVQLRGALMRRHDRRDGVRRPRALSQQGTRAASELLPGPLRVPARSWLIARPHHPEKPVGLSDQRCETYAGNGKRGPVPNRLRRRREMTCASARSSRAFFNALPLRYLSACGAPRGASAIPQGSRATSLRFSARHPPRFEGAV